MTRRDYRGRYTHKRMTAVDRLIVMGMSTFMISCGWSISHFSQVNAIDTAQAGQAETVQIVSSTPERADDDKPAGEATTTPAPTATPEPTPTMDNLSGYISEAVAEFLPTHKSESLMIMHCLAHRENGHAGNLKARGDNGKAIGAFQFHQPTWERMRNQMIKAGVATEISDPMNVKEATRTTAWAIANGRAREWGPIYRKSNGSDYAVCQVPSWYQ